MASNPGIKLAPSILSADFGCLGEQVREISNAGADYIHVDVMDGHFVPNISFGPVVLKAVRKATDIPLDVHLMIQHPQRQIEAFAASGADIITVSFEACAHIHRTIQLIKDAGKKAGCAINPGTPLSCLDEILPFLDLVLVMTVNPGAGGQKFINGMPDKISRMRSIINSRNLNCELEVDGGIKTNNAHSVVQAGADVLVAGSAIFHPGEAAADAMTKMRAVL